LESELMASRRLLAGKVERVRRLIRTAARRLLLTLTDDSELACWVNSIYQQHLGRTADADGLQHFVGALRNGMSLSQLMQQVENSSEAVQRRQELETERAYCVNSIYQQHLGSTADADGLQHFVSALRNGMSLSQLIQQIESRPEAVQRRQELETERAYCVNSIYQQHLGRTADADGLQHCVSALRNGMSLSRLIQEIENSPEAARRRQELETERVYCVNSIYQQHLGRTADADALQHFVGALRDGMPLSRLLEEIENSPEAVQRLAKQRLSDGEFIVRIFTSGEDCSREALDQMTAGPCFEIDRKSAQRIMPQNPSERFEGIDFSPCGNIMAIATSDTNKVLLFRRKPDGRFEEAPFRSIG
jgi:hypothetical protein